MPLSVVILAAGQGKRMHSDLPKVLQPLGGGTLLEHVLRTATRLNPAAMYVVYGHGGEQVVNMFKQLPVQWVLQAEQLGTGHALMQALPQIPDEHDVLVLYGDVPMLRQKTLEALVASAQRGELAILTANLSNSTGYGRILRDAAGEVRGVVEEKDATPEQRRLKEASTGPLAAHAASLRGWLKNIGNDNAQKEYYLPDVIGLAVKDGTLVTAILAETEEEVAGVNDRRQLAAAERALRRQSAEALMQRGVTLRDPERIDLRGDLQCGRDVLIDINCIFEGRVRLGNHVRIGPNVLMRDCELGDDTEVFANCVLENAVVGARARIGPFARIRPETLLADEVHIGNFVEVKQSRLGRGTKANHLAYLGDAEIGKQVNVGAGTITCNYDGVNKHRTVIGDDAFIGSNSSLVAPVTVGAGATIGAGSVISKDAPAGELTLERAEQRTVKGWKRPKKQQ
ncbi:MAG: bifunctional UDP-N-acetylglucosamine diphosphorylase/glucosamine-1-phosphate N-acetyltransferase GlmU [Gammaproteobacteria bacterium]|nr:bifunctional UDP-N-acetylglucosamine diphosphorylase/glucosamine-1-phosphate N-acetyltransferase GlmU [Gammaproteobacteria bacterium]MBU6510532.1 bifunctional UDP-N-acetylglucosamine diphosphorylase/glucosamine-1-phosphate N-acetyltransferase GlmU [Gammaproteobacteria bacterium]MDE2107749.1 bifunctional UDP-N-acetylglucosamine diphosphorylase/glucosamine-1-phosphate N-acetyltransferase GlmU [Gammaproteobacteria bacterium]